jgi:diguanylate cyclase (GGDEF)-like protein
VIVAPYTRPDPIAIAGSGDHPVLNLVGTLRDSLMTMSAATGSAEVLQHLVTAAEQVLPETRAWLIRPATRVFDRGAGSPGQAFFAELPAPGSVRDLVFDLDLQAVTTAGRPVIGGPEHEAPAQLRRLLADAQSWLLLPLICEAGPLGVLVLAASPAGVYAETELAVIGVLAAQALVARSKAVMVAGLRELSGSDELTGVRSLRQVLDLAARDLQGARLSSRPLAVMVIGVDRLGRINSMHGRGAGDDVLRQVALRTGQVIRETDLIGRYREDEFVVVLSQGRGGESGIGDGGFEVAERVLTIISQTPLETRAGPLPVTVTIGLTLMTKDDADVTMLTTRAESALQIAKQAGRNQVTGI